jgi:hypothetical protein
MVNRRKLFKYLAAPGCWPRAELAVFVLRILTR